MRLARLTGLEMEKLEEELTAVTCHYRGASETFWGAGIAGWRSSPRSSTAISKKYGDDRRTEIIGDASSLDVEDLIADEEMVITVSRAGIREADRSRHVPRPEAWRTGAPGYGYEGGGLGGAPVCGVSARIPDDFHPVGSVPLVEGMGRFRRPAGTPVANRS